MHSTSLGLNNGGSSPRQEVLSSKKTSIVLETLCSAVSSANKLPSADQLLFFKTISPNVEKHTLKVKSQLLKIFDRLTSSYILKVQPTESDSYSSSGSQPVCHVKEALFNNATDAIDEAIDHFNNALDAARGIENAGVALTGAIGPDDARKLGLLRSRKQHLACLDIEKPQIQFPDYPIDNSDTPFVPPYQNSNSAPSPNEKGRNDAGADVNNYLQELYRANSCANGNTRHPFEDEIMAATAAMSERPFNLNETTVYKQLDKTPFTFITTEEQLVSAVDRIKSAAELAVDLENHSVRSFQGFTCLMQLSTRREDFVIDLLTLRGSIHRLLSPIFADASMVKVLHGADYDVQWLERDFGIYVVNMFDTGQAARLLQYPSAGLWYLLSQFCSVPTTLKRKYQLADWRVRPIPEDMLSYARSDTHYLLYVYDRLRDDLNKKGLLPQAWEKSALVCRKRYVKPRFHTGMARELAARHGLGLDTQQMRLLDVLCTWRDATAREEDESLAYVSPLPVLFGIVLARDKARSVDGLFKHGFPGGFVPPLLRSNGEKITQFVCDALDAPDDGTAVPENLIQSPTQVTRLDRSDRADEVARTGPESGDKQESVEYLSVKAEKTDSLRDKEAVVPFKSPKMYGSTARNLLQAAITPVSQMQKSTLFGSDFELSASESDNEDESDDENVVSGTEERENIAKAYEKDVGGDGMEQSHEHDSSDGGEGQSAQLDLVAKVHEEIADSLRKFANRSVLIDKHDAEGENGEASEPGKSDEKDIKKEEDIFSLEEIHGQKRSGLKGQKRKRATTVKKEVKKEIKKEIKEEIKVFDYSKEAVKMEKVLVEQYDPLQVRHDRFASDRARLRKRRKGKAKSMTFSS